MRSGGNCHPARTGFAGRAIASENVRLDSGSRAAAQDCGVLARMSTADRQGRRPAREVRRQAKRRTGTCSRSRWGVPEIVLQLLLEPALGTAAETPARAGWPFREKCRAGRSAASRACCARPQDPWRVSVTVSPRGSRHWRRMNAPGWGGSCMSIGVASPMVVLVVDVEGVAVLEAEDDAPVGRVQPRPRIRRGLP